MTGREPVLAGNCRSVNQIETSARITEIGGQFPKVGFNFGSRVCGARGTRLSPVVRLWPHPQHWLRSARAARFVPWSQRQLPYPFASLHSRKC